MRGDLSNARRLRVQLCSTSVYFPRRTIRQPASKVCCESVCVIYVDFMLHGTSAVTVLWIVGSEYASGFTKNGVVRRKLCPRRFLKSLICYAQTSRRNEHAPRVPSAHGWD